MRAVRTVALATVVLLGGACGTADPAPSVSTLPPVVATPAPTATSRPSPQGTQQAPSASPTSRASPAEPTIFQSVVYPYTFTLPTGALTRTWKAATIPWDGATPIRRESKSVDLAGTRVGSLIILGMPATEPNVLGDLVRDNTSRFNACKSTSQPSRLDVDGVDGVTFAQVCLYGTTALTAVFVKDGNGLVFRVTDYTAPDRDVIDQLRQWMTELTWR